jgi:uncharacterized delta-60 repeat protein
MALTRSGTIDRTFGTDGLATLWLGHRAAVESLRSTPEGGSIVAGNVLGGDALRSRAGFIARFSEAGEPDVTIGDHGGWLLVPHPLADVAPLSDGRIALAYTDIAPNGRPVARVEVLLPGGTVDPSFSDAQLRTWIGGRRGSSASSIEGDDVGGLLLLGRIQGCIVGSAFVARILADGRLDRSFSGDGVTRARCVSYAPTMELDPEGRILVAGSEHGAGSGELVVVVWRFMSNGRVDRTFGTEGRAAGPYDPDHFALVADAAVGPEGSIVVVGRGFDYWNGVEPSYLRMVRFLAS